MAERHEGAELALVERAYGALTEQGTWAEVMSALNARFDLTYSMISTRSTGPTLLNAGLTSARPHAVREVLDYWAAHDTRTPRYIRSATAQPGRWVSDAALYENTEIAASPLHHDYFRPRGADDFIGTSLRLGHTDYFFLAGLPVGRPVPPSGELARLIATLGHLVRAADLWIAHRRAGAVQDFATGGAGRPVLLVDRQGRWHWAGAAARRLLADRIAIEEGRAIPTERRPWAALLAAIARDDDDLPAVVIERPKCDPLVLAAHRIACDPVTPFDTGDLALVLTAHDTAQAPALPDRALQALGLTPAEARLAARVGRARSPAEAAADLGISLATARGTLAVVYGKLGISRQAELVRLVTLLLH